jgi:hypothetical protein
LEKDFLIYASGLIPCCSCSRRSARRPSGCRAVRRPEPNPAAQKFLDFIFATYRGGNGKGIVPVLE